MSADLKIWGAAGVLVLILLAGSGKGEELLAEIVPSEVTICRDEPLLLTFVATNISSHSVIVQTDPRCFSYRIKPAGGVDNGCIFRVRQEGFGPPEYGIEAGESVEVSLPFAFFMGKAEGWDPVLKQRVDVELGSGEYDFYWKLELGAWCKECSQEQLEGRIRVKALPRDENRLVAKYRELVKMYENMQELRHLELYNGSLSPRMLLYRIRDPRAVAIIAELLGSDDYGARLDGLNSLRGIHTAESLHVLEDYWNKRNLSAHEDYYVSCCIEGIKSRLKND